MKMANLNEAQQREFVLDQRIKEIRQRNREIEQRHELAEKDRIAAQSKQNVSSSYRNMGPAPVYKDLTRVHQTDFHSTGRGQRLARMKYDHESQQNVNQSNRFERIETGRGRGRGNRGRPNQRPGLNRPEPDHVTPSPADRREMARQQRNQELRRQQEENRLFQTQPAHYDQPPRQRHYNEPEASSQSFDSRRKRQYDGYRGGPVDYNNDHGSRIDRSRHEPPSTRHDTEHRNAQSGFSASQVATPSPRFSGRVGSGRFAPGGRPIIIADDNQSPRYSETRRDYGDRSFNRSHHRGGVDHHHQQRGPGSHSGYSHRGARPRFEGRTDTGAASTGNRQTNWEHDLDPGSGTGINRLQNGGSDPRRDFRRRGRGGRTRGGSRGVGRPPRFARADEARAANQQTDRNIDREDYPPAPSIADNVPLRHDHGHADRAVALSDEQARIKRLRRDYKDDEQVNVVAIETVDADSPVDLRSRPRQQRRNNRRGPRLRNNNVVPKPTRPAVKFSDSPPQINWETDDSLWTPTEQIEGAHLTIEISTAEEKEPNRIVNVSSDQFVNRHLPTSTDFHDAEDVVDDDDDDEWLDVSDGEGEEVIEEAQPFIKAANVDDMSRQMLKLDISNNSETGPNSVPSETPTPCSVVHIDPAKNPTEDDWAAEMQRVQPLSPRDELGPHPPQQSEPSSSETTTVANTEGALASKIRQSSEKSEVCEKSSSTISISSNSNKPSSEEPSDTQEKASDDNEATTVRSNGVLSIATNQSPHADAVSREANSNTNDLSTIAQPSTVVQSDSHEVTTHDQSIYFTPSRISADDDELDSTALDGPVATITAASDSSSPSAEFTTPEKVSADDKNNDNAVVPNIADENFENRADKESENSSCLLEGNKSPVPQLANEKVEKETENSCDTEENEAVIPHKVADEKSENRPEEGPEVPPVISETSPDSESRLLKVAKAEILSSDSDEFRDAVTSSPEVSPQHSSHLAFDSSENAKLDEQVSVEAIADERDSGEKSSEQTVGTEEAEQNMTKKSGEDLPGDLERKMKIADDDLDKTVPSKTALHWLHMNKEEKVGHIVGGPHCVVPLTDIPDWAKMHKYLLKTGRLSDKEEGTSEDNYEPDDVLASKICVHRGGITKIDVDVIVNAANDRLLAGGGVCGAIHREAGPELQVECNKIGFCATGDAVVTCGFRLPATYVFHAVGPRGEKPDLLQGCYKRCLDLMITTEIPVRDGDSSGKPRCCKSIAFPCISTGIFGYPNRPAAQVVLKTVRDWLVDLKENGNLDKVDRIVFNVFTEEDESLYNKFLPKFFPISTETQP